MMIMVDDRTGSAGLLPLFPPGVARLARLEYGDFAFSGNGREGPVFIGVERKTVRELLDGRLLSQLPGLLASYNQVYLVVEGIWRPGPDGLVEVWRNGWETLDGGLPAARLDGLLNTLAVRAGLIIRETSTPAHTVSLVCNLYRWWQKPWESHRSIDDLQVPQVPILLRRPGLVARVAAQLPGVGLVRARAVGEAFRSVAEMVEADERRWESVPGIGKVLARRIASALHGDNG